ncbi:MAG: hypothetical protein V4725_01445 [Bacteroidota bacterium]|nr:hypothetical protein [Ferruginibacter sp.]
MSETLQEYEQSAPARPIFLTVLCILTFIGSAYYLATGMFQVFTAEKQAQLMVATRDKTTADIEKSGKDDAGTQIAGKVMNSMGAMTAENIRNSGIAASVSALFCFLGAFMMWKLKKTGFYIYIVGTVIGIVAPFLIYGSGNMVAIFQSVFSGFVGIVFIVLYGVNVKHMR